MIADEVIWRAIRTPEGCSTLALRSMPDGAIRAAAWGPGRDWAITQLPALCGAGDDDAGFDASQHPLVADAARRHPGLRLSRTDTLFDVLASAIIEQKVTAIQAFGAWRALVTWCGERAPGPTPRVPVSSRACAGVVSAAPATTAPTPATAPRPASIAAPKGRPEWAPMAAKTSGWVCPRITAIALAPADPIGSSSAPSFSATLTASAAGLVHAPKMGAYNATKAAAVALGETLDAELRPRGVSTSVICP